MPFSSWQMAFKAGSPSEGHLGYQESEATLDHGVKLNQTKTKQKFSTPQQQHLRRSY